SSSDVYPAGSSEGVTPRKPRPMCWIFCLSFSMLNWMSASGRDKAGSAEEIAATVERIAASDLSVDEYFRRNSVPFSRAQYFRYWGRLATQGMSGLQDGRSKGNHRKLTPEAECFLRGLHQGNPGLSLQELGQSL